MRALKEEEMEKVMKKLYLFIGDNSEKLLASTGLHYHNGRAVLVSDSLHKGTSQISRKQIISCGTVLGKFTKTGSFRITITALHTLEKYALCRVWLKTSAEMNFLYENNALKSHIQKISESIPLNAGVFVYNHHGTPLGFGIMAVNPTSYERARSGDIVVLLQADNGQYVRDERAIS